MTYRYRLIITTEGLGVSQDFDTLISAVEFSTEYALTQEVHSVQIIRYEATK